MALWATAEPAKNGAMEPSRATMATRRKAFNGLFQADDRGECIGKLPLRIIYILQQAKAKAECITTVTAAGASYTLPSQPNPLPCVLIVEAHCRRLGVDDDAVDLLKVVAIEQFRHVRFSR
jgi:hypothetical protein